MAPLLTTPGGNPVMALPGLTPMFPTMDVAPVLVTVEPPKIEKFCASPNEMVWAVTGDKDVATSTETINVTAQTASDLRVWVLRAVWCKPLLACSESLTDSQCEDCRRAAAPNMAQNDQHIWNQSLYIINNNNNNVYGNSYQLSAVAFPDATRF
jgi:hypothetical protein